MVEASTEFEQHRGRLLGLAYRMLGSRAEAEDAVQDAWLRWAAVREEAPDSEDKIENPEAFLVRVTTRLCLDRLKSARAQRELYVGTWLPEPVTDAESLSPHAATELAEDLSFALLLALERLSPLERAAFLLHDVFDASYREVATTLGRSEAACRQLASRARRAVRSGHSPLESSPAEAGSSEEHRRLLAAFVEAAGSGDVSRIESLLTEDAVALSDGGGRVLAALNPIRGANRVARFVDGVVRKFGAEGPARIEEATINGTAGVLVYADERLIQTVTADVVGGRISALYVVRNPEKLGAVGGGDAPQ